MDDEELRPLPDNFKCPDCDDFLTYVLVVDEYYEFRGDGAAYYRSSDAGNSRIFCTECSAYFKVPEDGIDNVR